MTALRVNIRRIDLAWSEHGGRGCLHIGGWAESDLRELRSLPPEELNWRFAVLPSELIGIGATLQALQAMAGDFKLEMDALCFMPRFPFVDGLNYSLLAGWTPGGWRAGGNEVWTIQRPRPEGAATASVVAIYPSADELPVNALKLYIHFSAPMSEGWVARAVQARRADTNQLLQGVFLAAEPELWDTRRQRLTLLLDPARIKRGLAAHDEAGYPLIEGAPIIVSIAPEFRDAKGLPLCVGAERRYDIGQPMGTRVNPASWRLRCPAAGSRGALAVEFDRPLDHALMESCLWVEDAAGRAVDGRGFPGAAEGSWRFEPQTPWKEGHYSLVVESRLEDLAGNSLARVFDRDLTLAEDAPVDARSFKAGFICGPSSAPIESNT